MRRAHRHREHAKRHEPYAEPRVAYLQKHADSSSTTASLCRTSRSHSAAERRGCTGSSVATTCDPKHGMYRPRLAVRGPRRSRTRTLPQQNERKILLVRCPVRDELCVARHRAVSRRSTAWYKRRQAPRRRLPRRTVSWGELPGLSIADRHVTRTRDLTCPHHRDRDESGGVSRVVLERHLSRNDGCREALVKLIEKVVGWPVEHIGPHASAPVSGVDARREAEIVFAPLTADCSVGGFPQPIICELD